MADMPTDTTVSWHGDSRQIHIVENSFTKDLKSTKQLNTKNVLFVYCFVLIYLNDISL